MSAPSSTTLNPVIDRRRVIDQALIDEVVSRIVAAFDPEEIILFGSHARGDARVDSDLDLLVIMDSDLHPVERALEIDRLFGFYLWAMDVFVYTRKEFEEDRGCFGTLVSAISNEGKTLYARK